ncbi:alpha/beta hydrolase [Sphingomonas koreensis]|nr:alpha/beta hydrolase [Sphingomonas koreensis]
MISFLKTRLLASAITLMVVLQPAHSHAAPAVAAAASPITQMDHISIEAIGKGPPVILIPGLSSPRAVYDGVIEQLAKSHRVFRVQVNGFGGDDPGANLQPGLLDGVVADLDSFIAKQKIAGAAVAGHSMGGLVGLMLAKAHPGDVGKLMVVDSLPYIGDIFIPGATVAQVEPQAKLMRDKEIASYGKPADDAAATATANGLALKPDSRSKVIQWFKAADPRVTGEALYEDMTTDLRTDMAAITTPITLVYPWSDQLPKEKADGFYKAEYAKAPHVTYVPIGDSAHFVMLDQPAAFQAALDAFLAK